MLNSITLSSDMKTLYLIDNDRAIAYDLTVAEGVLVGLLGKQLVVATAVTIPPQDDTTGETATIAGASRAAVSAEKRTYKVTKNSQYTITYNEEHETLGIIGYEDIDTGIEAPDTHPCKENRFALKRDKVVRFLNKENTLEITRENY